MPEFMKESSKELYTWHNNSGMFARILSTTFVNCAGDIKVVWFNGFCVGQVTGWLMQSQKIPLLPGKHGKQGNKANHGNQGKHHLQPY
jgi:uncharacterized membrane protein SpoIIM required for sporulation